MPRQYSKDARTRNGEMGRYSVKRYKTKRRTKDLDLIFEDLASEQRVNALLKQPLDETKPGLGQHYCIHCAKYFETPAALKTHLKGKVHKRRVKELRGVPYTQEVANAAAGTDVGRFMARVEQIKTSVGPQKERNEAALAAQLETALENAATREAPLPHCASAEAGFMADGEVEMN
ncbi:ABR234Cp [Eremothecium gossypii ATCC 10895]|uniref:ABR234Cp n=1 Tax=Eremothecium gossypii (strain ATCC 10895 / CBS 109.51 / FGSC 9923 / NRRL Y-1056) TaxID=284811 RepID=Q75CY8_EREGS|nr:ABR234Cp [Eremothecium gossypii ATCC 10895]AAS51007.1 ABR234Cp [Eremothecium gossypii ATCC 10895]AEY95296.1 FABR234Cp [Eremothecium gossypii FDAG1]